ncbi:hypothetical protein HII31_11879 [Pseudocercospora fuligena]|uniref:Uncharacterized protein n=1 Tax=Pseudocercospora fuligena TaxID=685502 RepID=A0A8H6RA93_9PEZI|nr:hypothetical protein HII31_11879 [Pseudocercospora fuligena]
MVSSVNTLHCSRWCQCLDQRDRIFATNSLTSKHSLRVVPDYDRPIEEVYTEFSARNLHHDDGKINLLSYHSKPNNLDNLASWVVDWTTPKRTAQELRGRASLDWDPPGREIEYGILHVYAVAGASIFGLAETDQFTDSALTEPKRGPKLGQMLRTFVSAAKRTGCIAHDNEEIVYALHRVLLAGEYAEAVSPPRPDYPSLRTGQRFLERMLNPEPDGEKPSVNDSVTILATIKERCQGRKLCITSNGAFGLVPSYAEPGDQIAVVLGCNNAIVLRDKGPDYELVGDAWLDGFMDGEALLGPVPPRYQVLNDRQHPMVLRPLFLDLETREITLQDPRKLIPRAPPKVVRIRIV